MSSSRLQYARPVRNKSLAIGAIVLSISCLSLTALAQAPDSQSALPDAPTPKQLPDSACSATTDHSLTLGERAHLYARSLISPDTIIGPAFSAAIGQWENEPPGWGQGGQGYADRFGSALGQRTISETIRFGFAAVDGEDPRYFLSEDRGIWARVQHAVVSPFVSKTSGGHTIPAFSRFAGTYGAAFITNTWYPDNRATAGYAARRGSTALAGTIGFHLIREFVPFLRRGGE